MKTLLVTLALAAATVGTARAEYYRPSIVRDTTIVGAVAGALIGGHNGDRWAQGALIGAAAGAVVGVAVDNSRPAVVYRERTIQPVAVVADAPTIVTQPAPQVIVVNPAPSPRVVYVERHAPPVVVVRRPVVYVSGGHRHYHHGYRDVHRHGHRW